MIHEEKGHAKSKALRDAVKIKYGKSIPQWAMNLFIETCPICQRGTARKAESAGHMPILTRGFGTRGQVRRSAPF